MPGTDLPVFFRWADDGAASEGDLGPRQRAWITGRMNYLALSNPGRELHVELELGGTTVSTRAVSTVPAAAPDAPLAVRLEVGPESPAAEVPPVARSLQGRIRQRLARSNPVLADEIRQRELWARLQVAQRRSRPVEAGQPLAVGPTGTVAAALVGMYWFEIGGAERWALRTVELLRASGIVPVVIVDAPGPHRLVGSAALDGAIVVIADRDDVVAGAAMVASLLSTLDVRALVIHHSHLLYRLLPAIRATAPDLPVVDSLHVVEWEDGGFPLVASRYSSFIDMHHVISPPLGEYLRRRRPDARVIVAPLLDLGDLRTAPTVHSREPQAQVTLGFVGRLVDQKRPYLMLELLHRLERRHPGRYRVVIHGDGPLRATLGDLASRLSLSAVEFVSSAVPVEETYRRLDILVIPSQIEGLTLTAMEAISRRVLVISADVGAQRTLVARDALLARHPGAFLRGAVRLLEALRRDAAYTARLVAEQNANAAVLSQLVDADEWMRELVTKWAVRARTVGPAGSG